VVDDVGAVTGGFGAGGCGDVPLVDLDTGQRRDPAAAVDRADAVSPGDELADHGAADGTCGAEDDVQV
jgi:hypothetical protein